MSLSNGAVVLIMGAAVSGWNSTVARCHQRASAYISAHQIASEGSQKHSKVCPKYVKMHPILGIDFVLSSCEIMV